MHAPLNRCLKFAPCDDSRHERESGYSETGMQHGMCFEAHKCQHSARRRCLHATVGARHDVELRVPGNELHARIDAGVMPTLVDGAVRRGRFGVATCRAAINRG
jgi:hypothetical protein